MHVILIVLGVMGLGAIAISAYVFVVAARKYVSEDQDQFKGSPGKRVLVERSSSDRRSGKAVTFPLTVNGILIAKDRRILPDRRLSAQPSL